MYIHIYAHINNNQKKRGPQFQSGGMGRVREKVSGRGKGEEIEKEK